MPAASAYFVLGVEHILFGSDDLLFVLALLLLVTGTRRKARRALRVFPP